MIVAPLGLTRVHGVLVFGLLILILLELLRSLLSDLGHDHSLVYLRIALRLLIPHLCLMHAHLLALVKRQYALRLLLI